MTQNSTAKVTVEYGAGPVSVQLTRGRSLVEAPVEPAPASVVMAPPAPASVVMAPPARDRYAHDRLALKHWPRGHRVLVCSLTGGTGRTTVAGLLASTLASLPFAHIWPPALLVTPTCDGPHDSHPNEPGDAGSRRADDELSRLIPVLSPVQLRTTPSGITLLQSNYTDRPAGTSRHLLRAMIAVQDRFAPVIIDSLCGLPSDSPWTRDTPAGFSLVLVVRPDEYSLIHAAEVLVWLHDRHLVRKQQVTVVVNHGAGPPTGRTRPTAAAVAVRTAVSVADRGRAASDRPGLDCRAPMLRTVENDSASSS